MEHVREELETVMEVMCSDQLIVLDLFWLCLIFTFLLSSLLHSVTVSILFFAGSFLLFTSLYFFIFKRWFK
jgi:hypothetical protein